MNSETVLKVDQDGKYTLSFAKIGTFVSKGQVLYGLKNDQDGKIIKIKAANSGKALKLLKQIGDSVSKGDSIIEFQNGGCDHPTIMKNMCADCGADLEQEMSIVQTQNSVPEAKIAIVHSIPELKVSSNEAQNLGREDEKRLLKQRRLVLLVDLDQTLIHTTNENVPANMRDVLHFQLSNHRSAPWYHTRIRPGTQEFLKKISSLYELHIVTFGARMYAHTIAEFLDPGKKNNFFSHRILSRDECFDSRSKTANLSSLFPCGDHMVTIIDDREDVWNFAPNLVHVKPYIFFKNTGDINAPPGSKDAKKSSKDSEKPKAERPPTERRQSIDMPTVEDDQEKAAEKAKDEKSDDASLVSDDLELSDDDDEESNEDKNNPKKEEQEENEDEEDSNDDLQEVEDHDDYLPYLEDILKNIHRAYYAMYDQRQEQKSKEKTDLKTVIPYVKRKVLQGTHLVFSGVVPTHISLEKSKAFMVAKSLGAKVSHAISQETTHLVAARTGTAKVNEARRLNDASGAQKSIALVTPDWLWCCAERWEKVSEAVFPLYKSAPVTLRPPAHCSSPEIAFAERCPDVPPAVENPLIGFSEDDLKGMDKEVEEMLSQSDSSDDEEITKDAAMESSDDDDSLTGEMPKGQKRKKSKSGPDHDSDSEDGPSERFRRGEDIPSDYEIASQSDDEDEVKITGGKRRAPDDDFDEDEEDEEEDEDDDELGAQLEREFLKDNNSRSSFTNE